MILVLPLIIAISLMVFYHIRSKNKQRELLIERGINPDGLSIIEYQKLSNLTNGVLFISVALGLFSASFVRLILKEIDFLSVYLSFVLLFGGIGFLVNYLIYSNAKAK
ncbi:hypothetical protein DXT99_26670 [Pontibacter diazotrophicus]|uniref:DUF6249 domain-containing protein n=1 Tax=Pontibacter diazotrophicus TaxID=1400979 RepID=A0A3D8KZ86_9BACT|nr:hypothetical protein DXT99_26670 [Pontibacter diazotrophicus]